MRVVEQQWVNQVATWIQHQTTNCAGLPVLQHGCIAPMQVVVGDTLANMLPLARREYLKQPVIQTVLNTMPVAPTQSCLYSERRLAL
jgi:preprotein translocase subunit SecA